MYQQYYSRFLSADPDRLHFAAHSHHYWPDVTRDAQLQYWDDAARLADDKWSYLFSEVVPRAQSNIASALGLTRPRDIALAPSTHELAYRLLSCFDPTRPLKILTTDSEFHSFTRQTERLAELPHVEVTRIPVDPVRSFDERFRQAVSLGRHQLIYFSHVFYNSGFAIENLQAMVDAVPDDDTLIAIDGYHAFAALPVDLSSIESRVFYLGGGYKYAQAGEGVCFMSLPRDCRLRPINTGWFASFGTLEETREVGTPVEYAEDGFRFWGATFEPSGVYRLNAVFDWMRVAGLTIAEFHDYVRQLQAYFIERIVNRDETGCVFHAGRLLCGDLQRQGHFFAFQLPDAGAVYRKLRAAKIVVDLRGDTIRFGFGPYQTPDDIDRLLARLAAHQL